MKQQLANEIVGLMSNGGPFSGLWVGEPMNAAQVVAYVEEHKHLPMQNGHTKNSLEMQNTRRKISRRIVKLSRVEEA